MRKELIDICEKDYWCYGLRADDFAYTIDLVNRFILIQKETFDKEKESIEKEHPSDISCEITSDNAHYNWVDCQYLWHFCLWRLQAIFEGIIKYSFLRNVSERLVGLKSKLDKMIELGYSIDKKDYDELLCWANLRNSFSHAPPEQYRPVPLDESDVNEYKDLVLKLCLKWRNEKK